MEFTWDVTLFIFLAQFLAYTVKWLIGFGNPLISAPLLSLRLDNTLITPGTLLPDLCVNTCIVWQNRKHFDWRRILPMLLAMIAGVIPGTWLLRFSMPWVVKTALGLVVAFLGLEMAARKLRTARPSRRRENPAARYLAAFFSGVCSGLFGIGLFLVAYLQRTARDYEEFKGSICFLFWGENLFRLALYCGSGMLDAACLQFSLISGAALLVSYGIARLLSGHIRNDTLEKLAIALFILGGVNITVRSLLLHA